MNQSGSEENFGAPIVSVNIENEMKASYLDYAMSVIIGRALPDVRDGLKPVHRRVLFAMKELSNYHNQSYKKSARVVGDVIGKYHPHGDQAVYDTLVRMAQDFSMRLVLVDGQGNFGSIDGDAAAAMRYTEVRMAKLSSQMLVDLEKETVPFVANYDGSMFEPEVLPTRFPNLLINGSSGIAVGMATNIPPHNLQEIIAATVALAKDPSLSILDLMQYVKGPDFPTGGIICGRKGVHQAYETGRGIIRVRGKAHMEPLPGSSNRERIVISEIPYLVNKSTLLERMAGLVRDKRIEGISDIRDESDRDGMRVVIDCKRDASGEIVLNQLYQHSALQSSFGINMVAIEHGEPRCLSLKGLLQPFIDHRRAVVTRRSRFELREAKKRFNVVFGLLTAVDSIDRVIEIIRQSPDHKTAKTNLMAQRWAMGDDFQSLCKRLLVFSYQTGTDALSQGAVVLNEYQAQAILEMRLSRLTGLERGKLLDEAEKLKDAIVELDNILSSPHRLLEVVVEELEAVSEEYTDPRRTEIIDVVQDMCAEDLIADEQCVVTVSHAGYVKRNPIDIYQQQRRGGRGKTAATTREEDFVGSIFVASTHSYVLVFTDLGKVYWLKVYEIPQAGRTSRGKPIVNLLRLGSNEQVAAVMPVRDFIPGKYLFFVTAKGYVKKTDLMEFRRPRASGLRALNIDPEDELMGVCLTDGTAQILLGTRMGMAIRFDESDVRAMGRTARGVRAIRLKKEQDCVVGMVVSNESLEHVLTISERGYGKRTKIDDYRLQARGGSGTSNQKITSKTGLVAGMTGVEANDEIMVVTNRGMMIRTGAEQISVIGRATQGVRVIAIGEDESVTSVAAIRENTEHKDEVLE